MEILTNLDGMRTDQSNVDHGATSIFQEYLLNYQLMKDL